MPGGQQMVGKPVAPQMNSGHGQGLKTGMGVIGGSGSGVKTGSNMSRPVSNSSAGNGKFIVSIRSCYLLLNSPLGYFGKCQNQIKCGPEKKKKIIYLI